MYVVIYGINQLGEYEKSPSYAQLKYFRTYDEAKEWAVSKNLPEYYIDMQLEEVP